LNQLNPAGLKYLLTGTLSGLDVNEFYTIGFDATPVDISLPMGYVYTLGRSEDDSWKSESEKSEESHGDEMMT
jgi:hypothetical protein